MAIQNNLPVTTEGLCSVLAEGSSAGTKISAPRLARPEMLLFAGLIIVFSGSVLFGSPWYSMMFQPAAVRSGEWWRLLTHPFVHITWYHLLLDASALGRPTGAQVAEVLAIIEAFPSPVFIHCEHGCDRTGTVIACYRIQHDQWTSTQALSEAVQYGMSKWEVGMKRFVIDYEKPYQSK